MSRWVIADLADGSEHTPAALRFFTRPGTYSKSKHRDDRREVADERN
jgi:hypothetical protein